MFMRNYFLKTVNFATRFFSGSNTKYRAICDHYVRWWTFCHWQCGQNQGWVFVRRRHRCCCEEPLHDHLSWWVAMCIRRHQRRVMLRATLNVVRNGKSSNHCLLLIISCMVSWSEKVQSLCVNEWHHRYSWMMNSCFVCVCHFIITNSCWH